MDELAALRLRCARAEAAVKALTEKNTALTDKIAALEQTACLEQGGAPKRPRLSARAAAARAPRPTPDVPIKALFDVCCASNILTYRTLRVCARVCKDWRARAESAASLLTVLDMSKTFAELGDVQAALQATGHRLVALDLSHTSGLADTAERAGELAARIMPTAPTLTSLAMSKADVADAASQALFQMIAACSKLEHLELRENRQLCGGSSELGAALSALTCLRVLDLGGTTIELHALGVALQRTSALQRLRLDNVELRSSALAAFEQGLSRQTSLCELDARRIPRISVPVLRSFWRALSCMPYMRRLLLDLPVYGADTLDHIEFDNLIRKALSDKPFLEHLQIGCMMESSWAALADSARGGGGWPCLTFLGLHARSSLFAPLTDAACQPIAHVLACAPSLRSLDLSSCPHSSKFSAAGGIPLWSALRQLSQLQMLNLGECDIGAEGAEALGEALADMSSLQTLQITLTNLNGKARHSFKTRIPSKVRIHSRF